MLEVRDISRAYGSAFALTAVSFGIEPGEIIGLVGPNGSGKTTLLETVTGIQPASAGEVLWDGRLMRESERKRILFYLPDGVRPYSDEYAFTVLALFGRSLGASQDTLRKVVTDLNLTDVLNKKVSALSKGFCKRVASAIALLSDKPLLLLDEPFDGLDLRQVFSVMELLRGEKSRGRSLLLSIHQLVDAEHICDKFLLLSGGKSPGFGTLDELRAKASRSQSGLEEVFLALT